MSTVPQKPSDLSCARCSPFVWCFIHLRDAPIQKTPASSPERLERTMPIARTRTVLPWYVPLNMSSVRLAPMSMYLAMTSARVEAAAVVEVAPRLG